MLQEQLLCHTLAPGTLRTDRITYFTDCAERPEWRGEEGGSERGDRWEGKDVRERRAGREGDLPSI